MRRSEPRERLLATARAVFYAEGIHAVGVDRLVVEAGVTKATFYRHFPAKEDLVVACLEAEDARIKAQVATAAELFPEPRDALSALVTGLGEEICGEAFRGCPFINAAAEYPDPGHPVRQVVRAHRTWFRGTLADLLRADGHPDPDEAAATLVFLRDGVMIGGYLDGAAVHDALAPAVTRLLSSA